MRFALKTMSYGLTHVVVAAAVVYAITGDFALAIGIGLIEPVVQTAAFIVHEYFWETHKTGRSQTAEMAPHVL